MAQHDTRIGEGDGGFEVAVARRDDAGTSELRRVRTDFLRLPEVLRTCRLPVAETGEAVTAYAIADIDDNMPALPGTETMAIAVVTDGGAPVARVALFRHDGEPSVGYVGLFESDGRPEPVTMLFDTIESVARESGMERLVGPVDGTIWERYRYKIEGFDEPTYTGDPNNPEAYPRLWEGVGFEVTDMWHSSAVPVPSASPDDKMRRRLDRALGLGYEFRGLECKDLADLHRLVSELYSGFPAYTPMPLPEFRRKFRPLMIAIDRKGTVIATKDDEVVGFLISVPNYASASGLISKIRMRVRPSCYVILYMGVAKGHEGIGAAMMATLRSHAAETGASGIAALIHEGKASGVYLKSLGAKRAWGYALYGKIL